MCFSPVCAWYWKKCPGTYCNEWTNCIRETNHHYTTHALDCDISSHHRRIVNHDVTGENYPDCQQWRLSEISKQKGCSFQCKLKVPTWPESAQHFASWLYILGTFSSQCLHSTRDPARITTPSRDFNSIEDYPPIDLGILSISLLWNILCRCGLRNFSSSFSQLNQCEDLETFPHILASSINLRT